MSLSSLVGLMPELSVIIPTLNAAEGLAETLDSLGDLEGLEVIISDGGSTDQTVAVAKKHGAAIVQGAKGRGGQLKRGAEIASGRAFIFLHADTVLPSNWRSEARTFLSQGDRTKKAAAFQLGFRSDTQAARRVERLANWRSRVLGLPYGDQGLVISRAAYEQVGGYADIPLMEDVDLVRRIGRQNIAILSGTVTTSAVRYERSGWVMRPVRNLALLVLFFCGVSPQRLARVYG